MHDAAVEALLKKPGGPGTISTHQYQEPPHTPCGDNRDSNYWTPTSRLHQGVDVHGVHVLDAFAASVAENFPSPPVIRHNRMLNYHLVNKQKRAVTFQSASGHGSIATTARTRRTPCCDRCGPCHDTVRPHWTIGTLGCAGRGRIQARRAL